MLSALDCDVPFKMTYVSNYVLSHLCESKYYLECCPSVYPNLWKLISQVDPLQRDYLADNGTKFEGTNKRQMLSFYPLKENGVPFFSFFEVTFKMF